MRKAIYAIVVTALASSTALAAPADVLEANKTAMGGPAWDHKASLVLTYAYSGQGLTGKVVSTEDLLNGNWRDDAVLGPLTQASGFDGTHSWGLDPSGSVTLQEGGDLMQIAVNEAFRRANMWWRSDRAGAAVVDEGTKDENGRSFEVLGVTPKGGKNFDAWFDRETHLLAKTVEVQNPQTITTTYADYAPIDGAEIARKIIISTGDVRYDQTLTLAKADFGAPRAASDFAAPHVRLNDYAIADGAASTTFPFHLYNNHIYADVSVNGKGPFQFIFDTGGTNLLTPALAASLGLKSEGQLEGGGAGSGHVDTGITKIQAVSLGNATIKDQTFAVLALDALSDIEGIHEVGMIGFETFRRFVTRIDYGAQTITLIRPDAFDPKDAGSAVPIAFDGNTIEAKAEYDGVKGAFTIDTGARSAITLNGPFADAHHIMPGGRVFEGVSGWGIGGASRGKTFRAGTFTFGPYSLRGTVAEISLDKGGAFSSGEIAGNIGAGILKRYVVTFDYEHQLMYLKPVARPVADLDTFDRAGCWFNQSKEGYAVVDVTQNAPAAEAGLKVGDDIVAVNGAPALQIPVYEMRRQLRDDAPGTVVTFTVHRGSDTLRIPVTLRDLI